MNSNSLLILALLALLGATAYDEFTEKGQVKELEAAHQDEVDSLNSAITELKEKLKQKPAPKPEIVRELTKEPDPEPVIAEQPPVVEPEPEPEPLPTQTKEDLIAELNAHRTEYNNKVITLQKNLKTCNDYIYQIDSQPYPSKSAIKPSQADLAKFEATKNQQKSPYVLQKAAIEAELIKQREAMSLIEQEFLGRINSL